MFTKEGISEPDISAELIIAHVLGKKMIHELPQNLKVPISHIEAIDQMCKQRLSSIPVPYIIGEWDFHDLTLKMKQPVLIPRPETEELTGFVCDHIRNKNIQDGRLLDIGCGSGAICIHLLHTFKQMEGVAIDIDQTASDLTKDNARIHGVQDRLQVLNMDICSQDVVPQLQQNLPFDLIISNPPYIPTRNIPTLQEEVQRYESGVALDGGQDGLRVIRQIIQLAPHLMNSEGQLWLEVDLGEPDLIKEELVQNKQISYLKTLQDFTKRDRFCVLEVN